MPPALCQLLPGRMALVCIQTPATSATPKMPTPLTKEPRFSSPGRRESATVAVGRYASSVLHRGVTDIGGDRSKVGRFAVAEISVTAGLLHCLG